MSTSSARTRSDDLFRMAIPVGALAVMAITLVILQPRADHLYRTATRPRICAAPDVGGDRAALSDRGGRHRLRHRPLHQPRQIA